jgi:hypothetical protein
MPVLPLQLAQGLGLETASSATQKGRRGSTKSTTFTNNTTIGGKRGMQKCIPPSKTSRPLTILDDIAIKKKKARPTRTSRLKEKSIVPH